MNLFHLSTTENIEQFLTNYEVFVSTCFISNTEDYVCIKVMLEDALSQANLSEKEIECLTLKMEGYSTVDIINELEITRNAVKKRIEKAYHKMIIFWLENDYYDSREQIDAACEELYKLETKWEKCGWL